MRSAVALIVLACIPFGELAQAGTCDIAGGLDCPDVNGNPPKRTCPFKTTCPEMVLPAEIRLVLDLSGRGQADGKLMLQAANVAFEDVRKDMPQLRMSVQDDGCDPGIAWDKAIRNISDPYIAAVVGHNCGSTGRAASEKYKGVMTFVALGSASQALLESADNMTFRMTPSAITLGAIGNRAFDGDDVVTAPSSCMVSWMPSQSLSVKPLRTDSTPKDTPIVCDQPLEPTKVKAAGMMRLKNALGYDVTLSSLQAYSAVWAVAAAIHAASGSTGSGSLTKKVSEQLHTGTFATGIGAFSFNKTGLITPVQMLVATSKSSPFANRFRSEVKYSGTDDKGPGDAICKRLTCDSVRICLPDNQCSEGTSCTYQCGEKH